MSEDLHLAFVALNGIPYGLKKGLLEKFSTVENILLAAERKRADSEAEEKLLRTVREKIDLRQGERRRKQLRSLGAWSLHYKGSQYPRWLGEIPDPPLALYGFGNLPGPEAICLGFVGSRRPSPYGARVARWLAEDLAQEGLVLVSGLARGIDAIGHQAALKRKKPTIAVLGCGIDGIYPPEHSLLKDQIVAGGAVISEFFIGEPSRREHFPQRNRVISGLSRGVLVVEAGEKSGALITARCAADQSREVFAVPGSIDAPLSMGTNRLISEGAKLVATSEDVLTELVPLWEKRSRPMGVSETARVVVTPQAQSLLRHFSCDTPLAVDDLVRAERGSVAEILQGLGELELKGVVAKQADARYVKL